MVLEHFHLSVNPFGIAPRLDFLYRSAAFEESMAHLVYGLDNSEAIVMITGGIGLGKTMAIQSFLSYLGDNFVSALVTNTNIDAKELLKLVLEDLGVATIPGGDKSDLLIAFKNFLIERDQTGQRIIVVVDEAQNLSREVLEEVRLLTNLGQGARQPVQIILVGQPELEATVERADLAQLRQRIRVHYKLEPLTRAELEEYVDHRMSVAGGAAGVFSKQALDRIHLLSGGVPRVVNTICGEALLAGYVAGHQRIEVADVEGEEVKAPEKSPLPVANSRPTHNKEETIAVAPPIRFAERTMKAEGGSSQTKPPRRSGGRKLIPWLAIAALICAAAFLAWNGQLDPLWHRVKGALGQQHEGSSVVQRELPRIETSLAVVPAEVAAAAPESTIEAAASVNVEAPTAGEADIVQPSPAVEAIDGNAIAAVKVEFFIHISSFRERQRAETMIGQFVGGKYPATVKATSVKNALWFRVYLGPFASRESAVQTATELVEEGTISYYKIVRSDEGDEL